MDDHERDQRHETGDVLPSRHARVAVTARKRWFLAGLLIATVGIGVWSSAAFFSAASVSTASGPLVITPAKVDIQSETGDTQHVELTLSNTGTDPLTIREVRTICGCTVASPLERYELQPGDETILHVKLQPPGVGTRETAITIITNSMVMPAIRVPVVLRGRTLSPPYVRQCPDEIRHSSADVGDIEVSFVVLCLEKKDAPPWLTAFEGESPRITVSPPTIRETTPLDATAVYREYELTLRAAAPDAGGAALTDVLRPRTRTEPTRPLPMIAVTISRQAAIRALPSTLLVRREQLADGPYVRRVAVVSSTEDTWDITAIEPSAPWVNAKIAGDANAGRFVEISIPAAPPQHDGPSQATLAIETTHPGCPRLSISVVVEQEVGGP